MAVRLLRGQAHLHPGSRGSGAGGARAAGQAAGRGTGPEPAPRESESRERALGRGLPSPEGRRGDPLFLPAVTLFCKGQDCLYERGLLRKRETSSFSCLTLTAEILVHLFL
ncbi:hypothetical protein NN561_006147 [Cricetulus griseus]